MNVTDTASAAGSALMDLQVSGVSQFKVSKAGAVTAVGVAIPTISSTDTLTNKTLSSPTLSGTVAGTPAFSGACSFTSTSGLTINPATGDSFVDITVGGTRWGRFGYISSSLRLLSYNSGSFVGTVLDIAPATMNATFNAAVEVTGALTKGGVAVPTISSTDTLTNKTLSSPTVSGTIAGNALFSGAIGFGGGQVDFASPAFNVGGISRNVNWGMAFRGGTSSPSAGEFLWLSYANAQIMDLTSTSLGISYVAIPAGGTTGTGLRVSTTANFGVFFGSGAPTLSAAKGSLYMRSDGSGINDRMYVNTDGSTTWTAVVTVA
jgi:hypothetical protein